MIEFLSSHFRYDTMNSWNRATSYARNVKLSRLKFPDNETRNRAYDLLQVEEAFDDVRWIMQEFAESYGHEWQAGFNGRSGGYIVLYQGGQRDSGYKSYCTSCYQRNYTKVEENSNKCGKCGKPTRRNYDEPLMETFTYPGKGVDMDEDFSEWDMYRLRNRVKLVMDFDRMCDRCEQAFINFCKANKAEERTISVPKQIVVAVPA